jgi:hypothetical protein
MLIGNWRMGWLAFEFDPRQGRYSRRLRAQKDSAVCGFGSVELTSEHGRMLFALYRSGGTIVFQAGPQSWPLNTSSLRFEHRLRADKHSSEFSVFQDDRLAFACRDSTRRTTTSTLSTITSSDTWATWPRLFEIGTCGKMPKLSNVALQRTGLRAAAERQYRSTDKRCFTCERRCWSSCRG